MKKGTKAGIGVAIVVAAIIVISSSQAPQSNKLLDDTSSSSVPPSQMEEIKEELSIELDILCVGNPTLCYTGTVTRIVDGDTLDVDGKRIRLSLTNTPELDESGFSEATAFTRTLCPVGSSVHVDQDDLQLYDKYGRLLGKVTCSGKALNSELLEANLAVIDTRFCSTSEFSVEDWAKKYGCVTTTPELKQQIPKESQTPTLTKQNQCDSSYPDVCIPPYPPDLDCGEISYKNFKVLPPDPHGLDRDNDGIGCESYSHFCK